MGNRVWAALRALTGLCAVSAMILAPIEVQAASPRTKAPSFAPMSHSGSSMMPRDLDALRRKLAPPPMAAGGLWEKLKSAIMSIVPADAIEIAKFSIDRPDDAASVFAHGVSQDYPFFALVGAAKVGRKITSLNFTYSKCIFPVTAIDTVWSKAESTVSNGVGKQDTNVVVDAAKSYAAEAAKEASNQAKAEVNAQLMQTIPYFGEIVTICRFAFETNLKAEKDIQMVVTDTAKEVADIYRDLSDGDVVDAVKGLLTLGLGSGTACKLVDSALSDGMIGKVPGLRTLSMTVCSGFMQGLAAIAGAVIELAKDIGNWAYEKGEAIYCGAKDLVGGSCGGSPPPPNAINKGLDYCKPYGGIDHMIYDVSKSPDKPFWVECMDGHIWQRAGGEDWYSTRAAEDAKKAKAKAENKIKADQYVASVRKAVDNEYRPRCPTGDQQCQGQLNLLVNKAVTKFWVEFAKYPMDPPDYAGNRAKLLDVYFEMYYATEEAKFRVLPTRWRTDFIAFWMARCPDEMCKMGVKIIGLGISLGIKQKHDQQPKLTYEQVSQPFYAEAQKNVDTLLAEARDRVLNKNITENASGGWADLAIGAWTPKCKDKICVDEIASLAAEMAATAKKLQAQQPNNSSLNVQGQAGKIYGPRFKAAVDASVERDLNKQTTKNASEGWEQLAVGVWSPKCRDQQCRDEVKSLAAKMKVAAKLLQMGKPNESSLAIQGEVGKEYGPKFKAAVDASIAREKATIRIVPAPTPTPGPIFHRIPGPVASPTPTPRRTPAPRRVPAPVATPTRAPSPTPIILRRVPVRPVPVATPTPTPAPVRTLRIIRPSPSPAPTATSTPVPSPVLRRVPLRPRPSPSPTPRG